MVTKRLAIAVGLALFMIWVSPAESRAPTIPGDRDEYAFYPVVVTPLPTIAPLPTTTLAPTPSPTPKPAPVRRVTGVPTWYCNADTKRAQWSRCHHSYPDGPGIDMYAAAGPSLRIGNWRNRVVTVCAASKCIKVKLIDWCACGGNHFLDLYYDAWSLLGKPRIATVSW